MSEGLWSKKTLVIAIATGTLALAGCNDDNGNTSTTPSEQSQNTINNFAYVSNPRGSITGLVTDTNGYPIEGATVYLGNNTAVTNAGGQYYFDDVAVTQTVKNDTDGYAQALSLTILPPSGYLRATVTVQPQAQIFTGTQEDSAVEGPITTFIDGFNASAGTAVLPALTASVEGVLRHAETGEALGNVLVGLDMVSTSIGVDQEQPQDGVTTSYGTQGYTATTSSNGSFSFSNVPADAILRLAAQGYEVEASADTSDEHTGVNLGSVDATPILSADTISPWVKMVQEVVDQNAGTGMLRKGTTNSITLQFSERMANGLDGQSVVVRDVTGATYLNSTLSFNSNRDRLTINLSSPAPEGHDLDILLLVDDFQDVAQPSNALTTGTDIGFDQIITTAQGSTYVKLSLKAYKEANQDATQVTDFTQQERDEYGVDNLGLVQAINSAFADVDDDREGIHQLNSALDYDGINGADSAERLTALLGQIAGTVGLAGDTTVHVDNALVHFEPTNASYYRIEVLDKDNESKWNALAAKELKGPGELDTTIDPDFGQVVAHGANTVELLFDGVVPGDKVVVTPFDDFGYAGNPSTLLLVDNVPPTTALQTSYGAGDQDSGLVVALQYGSGGEQSAISNVEVGTPYLDLTPRLFGEVNGTSDGSQGDEDYINTFKRLFEYNTRNPFGSNNQTVAQGDYFIEADTGIYDRLGFAAWKAGADLNRTVGVAFTEALADDLLLEPLYEQVAGTVVPENFVVNNHVFRNDNDSFAVNADLVQFDVSDIYTFALQESGAVIDFTDSVADKAGNVATADANPKVVVRDMVPPMVESAVFEGRNLIVVFDKVIDIDAIEDPSNAMSLNGVSIDLSDSNFYNWDAATRTLTVNRRNNIEGDYDDLGFSAFDIADVFDAGQFNDASLGANVSNDVLRFRHGALDFSKIPNANGAAWADYDDATTARFFAAPEFAVKNRVRAFTVSSTAERFAGTNPRIEVSYSFTHEVDFSAADANSNGVLSSTEIADMFTLDSDASITNEDNTLSITEQEDGSVVYSFVLTVTADIQVNDELTLNGPYTSLYTGSSIGANTIQFN